MTREITRKEAIKIMEHLKSIVSSEDYKEALNMAIEALKDREYGKWKYTTDEKPNSTRHIIVAFGFSDISHYGYYLSSKDKWYTDPTCTNETPEPKAWMEMPEIPKDVRCDECCYG